jgi:hypothetical protein
MEQTPAAALDRAYLLVRPCVRAATSQGRSIAAHWRAPLQNMGSARVAIFLLLCSANLSNEQHCGISKWVL